MPQQLSPARWLEVLERRLDDRWFRVMGACDAYYEGDHRLAFATAKFREAFGGLFATIADNWMQLVVDASVERLKVQGFRFGTTASADERAWEIWQANGMDAEADMVHTEAVKLGEAYLLVEPPRPGSSDPPRISGEHPMEVIVACAPGDRRQRLAALKKWIDEDGYAYANVYLPDAIYKYRSQEKPRGGRIQWIRREDDPGGVNPLGVVPIVPLRNNPSMLRGGRSDLAVAIPIQDAINKLLSDMLVGAEYQAFPQRVLLGVEVPKDPLTGQPIKAVELQSSQSRLWAFEAGSDGADPKVAEFTPADLNNYVNARQHLVRGLTAKTRTPPHYVLGEIVNASGDALKAAETGLVAKIEDKIPTFSEGHEDTMRLAFHALGDRQRAGELTAETLWRNPESRSFAQVVDGAVKLKELNIPDEMLWEEIGYSPQKIARIKALQLVDSVFGNLNAPDGGDGDAGQ